MLKIAFVGPSVHFFDAVKSGINCASDGVVETTKTSLPCSPAVDYKSGSWISRANSVTLRILLSCIPCKYISAKFAHTGVLDNKSLIGRFVV